MCPTNKTPRLDEIGPWSEVKLDLLKRYAVEYSRILAAQKQFKHCYVDAFAGAGVHISRTTQEMVLGSPLNALQVEPPFAEFHLIDLDSARVELLRQIIGSHPDVYLYEGDCNKVLLQQVFPRIRYEDYKRGLCLLDPYGLHLDWGVIETAGKMKTLDLFINFPIYDININVLRRDPVAATEASVERMNKFWGDDSWKTVAYSGATNLFGYEEKVASNEIFAEAFRKRLQSVAGFEHVPKPLAMRNEKRGAIVYYLFFASQKGTAEHIVKYIFEKYGRT
jgi:three-Cys-motif partner protein